MSLPPQAHAVCPSHPDEAASSVCGRCGMFMCPRCERRVRPDAPALCPGCWDLRTAAVARFESKDAGWRLQAIGLVLGVLSLLPFLPVFPFAALVVNVIALRNARRARGRPLKPIIALVLTALGFVGWLVLLALR